MTFSFLGLVDHNLHKGISHKLALNHNIATARLPIEKFLNMKTRKVLTIDHVFRILGSITEGQTWQEALLGVLPPRKGAIVIQEAEEKRKQDKGDESKEDEDEKKVVETDKTQQDEGNVGGI